MEEITSTSSNSPPATRSEETDTGESRALIENVGLGQGRDNSSLSGQSGQSRQSNRVQPRAEAGSNIILDRRDRELREPLDEFQVQLNGVEQRLEQRMEAELKELREWMDAEFARLREDRDDDMNDLQQKIEAVRQEIEAVGEGIEAVRQGVEAESRRNIRYRRFMIMPQCFDYLGMAWNGIGGREMFTVPNDEENPSLTHRRPLIDWNALAGHFDYYRIPFDHPLWTTLMSTKVGVFIPSPTDSGPSPISARHLASDVKVDQNLLYLLSDLFRLVEAVEYRVSPGLELGPELGPESAADSPQGVERLLLRWILYTIGPVKARQVLSDMETKNLPLPDPSLVESLGQLIYGD